MRMLSTLFLILALNLISFVLFAQTQSKHQVDLSNIQNPYGMKVRPLDVSINNSSLSQFSVLKFEARADFKPYQCGKISFGSLWAELSESISGLGKDIENTVMHFVKNPDTAALLFLSYYSPTTAAYIEDLMAQVRMAIQRMRVTCDKIDGYIANQGKLGRKMMGTFAMCMREKRSQLGEEKAIEECSKDADPLTKYVHPFDEKLKTLDSEDNPLYYKESAIAFLSSKLGWDPSNEDHQRKIELIRTFLGDVTLDSGVTVRTSIPVMTHMASLIPVINNSLRPLFIDCVSARHTGNFCPIEVIQKLKVDPNLTAQIENHKKTQLIKAQMINALGEFYLYNRPDAEAIYERLVEEVAKIKAVADVYNVQTYKEILAATEKIRNGEMFDSEEDKKKIQKDLEISLRYFEMLKEFTALQGNFIAKIRAEIRRLDNRILKTGAQIKLGGSDEGFMTRPSILKN